MLTLPAMWSPSGLTLWISESGRPLGYDGLGQDISLKLSGNGIASTRLMTLIDHKLRSRRSFASSARTGLCEDNADVAQRRLPT